MPNELSERKTPCVCNSPFGLIEVSRRYKPRASQISNTTPRVTPARTPLASGVVQTSSFAIQNKLLLAASATSPLVFSSSPSSAPADSASVRAMTCGSLLQVLKLLNFSPQGTRKLDVMSFQRGGFCGLMTGVAKQVITRNGWSAPRGE